MKSGSSGEPVAVKRFSASYLVRHMRNGTVEPLPSQTPLRIGAMSAEQSNRSGPIYIDGMSPNEILELPDEHLAALIAVGPIVFKVGSADVLGQVKLGRDSLMIELAQIDGGW